MSRPPSLRVVAPGALSLVEDLGRPGWFSSGVGVSGALDRRSLVLANRLVGNADGEACIETLMGGLVVEAVGAGAGDQLVVAVTGAPAPLSVDGGAVAASCLVVLRPGQRLTVGAPPAGVRTYLAVRGGLDLPPVLGSLSRDTLAGLGPEPLRVGDDLPVAGRSGPAPGAAIAAVRPPDGSPAVVRVRFGPREDWFAQPSDLLVGSWTVSSHADRVGIRLDREEHLPALHRSRHEELPTEGVPLGAIQVQPSGQPVVFLADHPITGGYPVLATVLDADLAVLGQVRPGQRVAFREDVPPGPPAPLRPRRPHRVHRRPLRETDR